MVIEALLFPRCVQVANVSYRECYSMHHPCTYNTSPTLLTFEGYLLLLRLILPIPFQYQTTG